MKIFIVLGEHGQYSDHLEWVIRAFKDRDQAVKFVNEYPPLLKNVVDEYKKTMGEYQQQCEANGAWTMPTNTRWRDVRGKFWDEKRRKDSEVERQYIRDYLRYKDSSQDVPESVFMVEVELV